MILTTLALCALPQATVSRPAGPALPPKAVAPSAPSAGASAGAGSCPQFSPNLCVPLDADFEIVPFFGGFFCGRNDDASHELALDGWSFDFYGTPSSTVWVNNNGNVSFGQPFPTYSASGFPIANFPMVAPFWGDVDTDADSGVDGVVWFREWSIAGGDAVNRLVITWDHVGYYSERTDLLNTFQLILTDGNDPIIGVGNNVCFCYDDMQWTTGEASGGVNGFGGTPATVGANQGNGADFFLIGRFDQPGSAYDGPGGNNDGVDFLDGQKFAFSVASSSTNVPPVFLSPTTVHSVEVGQTLTFDVESIGPETNQTVTLALDPGGLGNIGSVETPGNPASSAVTFTPDASQLGTHEVVFTATDDGTPVAQSQLTVTILVEPAGTVGDPLCAPAAPNSTGLPALLWAVGSDVASDDDVTLEVADLPPGALCLMATSQSTGVLGPFMGNVGTFCINGSDVGRYGQAIFNASSAGRGTMVLDLASLPTPSGLPTAALAGETWGWQLWYREPAGSMESNFSNAIRVTFQ